MHRLTRTATRFALISRHLLFTTKPTSSLKLIKINPKSPAAAFPTLHLTHTRSHTSSSSKLCRTPTAMDSTSATAASAEDFVHVEDEPVKSDASSSDNSEAAADESESVIDEAVNHEVDNVYEKKELPEELAQRVMRLTCDSSAEGGVCDVYLVGTAHVSTESCLEVQEVISLLKPQVVFVELCSSRVAVLTQDMKVPTMKEMVEMWKRKQNLFGILYSWFLAKVASKLEVFPGAEFRVAFEEAMKYGGKVILGDRPVQITLKRTWAKMPLWHKTKLVSSLLFQSISLPSSELLYKTLKDMDDVDMLTLVIQEMSKKYPTLIETLVNERDKYMSSTLLRVSSEHNSVVAVVGKGHLPGIQKHWKQPIEVKELLDIPVQRSGVHLVKILTSLGVAVAGVSIISGIYLSYKK